MSTSSGTIENGAEQAGRAAGYVEESVDAIKGAAAEAAERFTAATKDAAEDPQRFARESYLSIARYAREKPLETLAIGAGIGFVIGALWKR